MRITFLDHPSFLGYLSIPRFTRMLADGMKARGHTVEVLSPQPGFLRLPAPRAMQKWLGYLDQYLVFPREVRQRLKAYPPDTLFVFTDQAQGLWVPLVAERPHVIHCHDFLAQNSALGKIPENPTSWTGRQYQSLIRRGYSQGQHFISVSRKTREGLQQFLPSPPASSDVVYNGLNKSFVPCDPTEARLTLGRKLGLDLTAGYLLHVGGNQWYKNRLGVIEMYSAWRSTGGANLPLILIGEALASQVAKVVNQSPYQADIHSVSGLGDELVHLAYAGATVFLFPSLAEGFGWPIAEAMASGCPVITTNEAPMTEVAGNAGFLVPRRPHDETKGAAWAAKAATVVEKVVRMTADERKAAIKTGLTNAKRFDSETALDLIEDIYKNILQQHKTQ